MSAPDLCGICEQRRTLLEALRHYERFLIIERTRGKLHTAEFEQLPEARKLITSHQHHTEAAPA